MSKTLRGTRKGDEEQVIEKNTLRIQGPLTSNEKRVKGRLFDSSSFYSYREQL